MDRTKGPWPLVPLRLVRHVGRSAPGKGALFGLWGHMIIILGLILLLAAVVVGVAGVLGNSGSAHGLTDGFTVLGYHVTGSTGTVFLYGIVVGAIALLGLTLLLAGARRTSRRGRVARRDLKASRRETATVSQDRDDLIEQREAEHADRAANPEPTDAPAAAGDGASLPVTHPPDELPHHQDPPTSSY